jgi:hypothetical protein
MMTIDHRAAQRADVNLLLAQMVIDDEDKQTAPVQLREVRQRPVAAAC